MSDLVRFWFGLHLRVPPGAYLRHGFALMLVKYGVDAALIGLATGTLWTPLDYLSAVPLLLSSRLAGAPPYLAPALAAWTLPFLWVGVSMTLRRLLDAGGSAWWALLFFIPGASYVLMAALSFAPSAEPRASDARPVPHGERLPSALLSMAAGAAAGLALLAIGVLLLDSYGLAVFMGTPFTIGVVTAFLFADRYPASVRETFEVVTMTVLLVAGSAFVIGFEGAVCLLMVAPLGLVIALMGGVIGRELARWGEGPLRGAVALVLLGPGGALLEGEPPAPAQREVESAVVIDAPPEVVWRHVVAFSPIPRPESLLFRLGLAYPTHAEIAGEGVGAVRYCYFSTGAFVEPITAWEPGRRLAFDVVESPRPLEELSFRDVAPPHLDGYLVPRAGEFRLVDLGGRTRLEGSTWYEQRLRPEGYWVVISDHIIAKIHERVLDHIASEAVAR